MLWRGVWYQALLYCNWSLLHFDQVHQWISSYALPLPGFCAGSFKRSPYSKLVRAANLKVLVALNSKLSFSGLAVEFSGLQAMYEKGSFYWTTSKYLKDHPLLLLEQNPMVIKPNTVLVTAIEVSKVWSAKPTNQNWISGRRPSLFCRWTGEILAQVTVWMNIKMKQWISFGAWTTATRIV